MVTVCPRRGEPAGAAGRGALVVVAGASGVTAGATGTTAA